MSPARLALLVLAAVGGGLALLVATGVVDLPGERADAAPEAATPAPVAAEQPAAPASAGTPAPDGATPPAGSAPFLAARWVNEGGECNSGESFLLDPSGEYFDEGSAGTWTLAGDQLTITAVDIEHAGLGPSESGSTPRTSVVTVIKPGPDRLIWVDAEGRKSLFARCP
ncbi:MAG TPA: hypothetical protein VGN74_12235 [Brevundimonas sp.]|jgi:hypothetical protein|uniref:hypothetical protein n=1 Tax=Brevundimonas sp. TaxID=1871086 RepID=UPI002E109035|nr:hypothetical protein [Brevundimonas sp.]